MHEVATDFKITLAAARVNAGFTQSDVAQRLGRSRRTIQLWEKNGKMSVDDFFRLCKLYAIDPNHIFLAS